MKRVLLGVLLVIAAAVPVHAQVHVDIGIHFPAPPPLVVVPEMPRVQYVPPPPAEAANLFFYNGQYWAFVNGGWYVSPATTARGLSSLLSSCLVLSCSSQRAITMSRPTTSTSGNTASPRAGMRSGDASGPRSESGEVANTAGRTNKARVEGAATGETDSASTIAQDMRSAH